MNKKINLWNLKAGFYSLVRDFFIFRWILDKERKNLKFLMNRVNISKPMILDIGTGSGSTLAILKKGSTPIGLDISLNMLRRVKTKFSIPVLAGDVHFLPFSNNTFCLISAIGLTEYLPDITTFLISVQRVILKKGYFLVTISQPNLPNLLRNILGNRIYPLQMPVWEKKAREAGFTLIDRTKTLMQVQYLFQYTR